MVSALELLSNHRSIRKYTSEPIPDDLLYKVIIAGQAAASSSFLQGVTIIRVTDPEKRASFKEITGGQAYVEAAPEFLVFCADLSRPMRCCTAHGCTPAEGLTEHFIIATVDAALYAQNVAVAAESAGLGICYIGAIRNDAVRSGTEATGQVDYWSHAHLGSYLGSKGGSATCGTVENERLVTG